MATNVEVQLFFFIVEVGGKEEINVCQTGLLEVVLKFASSNTISFLQRTMYSMKFLVFTVESINKWSDSHFLLLFNW